MPTANPSEFAYGGDGGIDALATNTYNPRTQKAPPSGCFFYTYYFILVLIRQHSVGALYAVHGGGHNATGVTGALTAGVHPAQIALAKFVPQNPHSRGAACPSP